MSWKPKHVLYAGAMLLCATGLSVYLHNYSPFFITGLGVFFKEII